MSTASHDPAPWWEDLYDDLLAEVLLAPEDDAAIAATTQFLMERLELVPGRRVFDQCCGTGRLALPLAAQGIDVVGVDQAAAYVKRGRMEAVVAGLDVSLYASDAFEFVTAVPCDAAFNWWTSFGYSPDDAENARMLACAYESLRPGGRFALDTMNLPDVLRGFQPRVVLRRKTSYGEVMLVRESRLDLPAGMLRKTWTYHLPDNRRVSHASAVRLHLPHTLAELLRSVGFEEVVLYGGIDSQPLSLDSPRCIAVAQRPA
jgi:SAM-dependent methyltransferase